MTIETLHELFDELVEDLFIREQVHSFGISDQIATVKSKLRSFALQHLTEESAVKPFPGEDATKTGGDSTLDL